MKVLIIDNYDSFTFNLYQYVGEILQSQLKGFKLDVKRNNQIKISEIKKTNYNRIIISPGPGTPADPVYFGICAKVLTQIGKKTPILGVCLGMQGMAYCFGGQVIKNKLPMHGKTSEIIHDGKGVFKGLPRNLEVMRYHSLVADPKSLPNSLKITAIVKSSPSSSLKKSNDIEIMGLRHKKYPIEGIQFHPESFATEGGKRLLTNFLNQPYSS